MKVLVTGGTGFIGRLVVTRLLELTDLIVVLSRQPGTSFNDNSGKIKTVSGDIRNFGDVLRAVKENNVDTIMHIAYMLTAQGEENPFLAAEVNGTGTFNIFEAARICNVKRVVFCSSIAAFAEQEQYGERYVKEEEVIMKPPSIYGASKVFNELMASKFENRYGIEIPVVRIAAVYGTGREARGVTAWTSQMIAGAVHNKPVDINIRPDQKACFIYVEDAAEQLVRVALAGTLNYRVYNSGGHTATPYEFLNIVKKYYPKTHVNFNENAPLWPYPYLVDGKRIANETSFQLRSLESGLLDQINIERNFAGISEL